jgi:hypothetical protein
MTRLASRTARRARGPAAALLAALAILAAPARATTVLRQSVDTLTAGSEVVVRGVVEGVTGHVEQVGHSFRLARVRVEEALVGRAPAVVHVRLLGGAAATPGTTCAVPGVPDLVEGDEVLLFLERVPEALTTRPSRAPARTHESRRGGRALPASGPPPREQWMPLSLAVGSYRIDRGGPTPMAVRDAEADGLAQVGPVDPVRAAPRRAPLDGLAGAVRRSAAMRGGGGGRNP